MEFPKSVGRYPRKADVISYLDSYAKTMALEVRTNCEVVSITPSETGWNVRHSLGQDGADIIVLATGIAQTPVMPDWPGLDSFTGSITHSSAYKSANDFKKQRALVVGFGNSGGDIALDLAQADATVSLSVRGPVNLLPKELFGIPITSFGILRKIFSYKMADAMTAPVLRMKLGKTESYGLQPMNKGALAQIVEDGRVPLIDVGTLAAIKARKIEVKPGITQIEGAAVHFADGKTQEYDSIIAATGYQVDLSSLLPETPHVLSIKGEPKVSGAPSGADGLYFCSYKVSPNGQLFQMGLEAKAIAALAKSAL